MPKMISPAELPTRITKLLEERQQHADALARIDETLAGINAALGSAVASKNGKKPAAAQAAPKVPGKRRRGRGHFALSAEESILAFVKQQRNPTTSEVNQHLKDEGRSSTANNALGKLVRENKLDRAPLGKGIRGSRYSLA